MSKQSVCQLNQEQDEKTKMFFEMYKQVVSSKILSFIREMVLKITDSNNICSILLTYHK